MKGRFRFGLRTKLILPVLVSMALATTFSAWMTASTLYSSLYKEFITRGTNLSKILSKSAQSTLLGGDAATIQDFLDENKNLRGVAYIFVTNEKHEILAHTFSPQFPDDLLWRIKNEDISQPKTREVIFESVRNLDISAPVLGGTLGNVHVGMNLDLIRQEITEVTVKVVLASIIFSMAGILVFLIISHYSIRAIHSLSTISWRIANGGDLSLPIDVKQNDEIGILADSFRTMVSNLKYQKEHLEELVAERTEQLTERSKELADQQARAISKEKMASLGEMASGIAHEINNPLAIILANVWQLQNLLKEEPVDRVQTIESLESIDGTAKRIATIVKSMRSFARESQDDPFIPSSVESIIEDTLVYCRTKFANNDILLKIEIPHPELVFECRPTQISQIILNFLNNAFDAVLPLPEKWIELRVEEMGDQIKIQVTDSGKGIPVSIQNKISQPFFTTKEPGKGTGLGLSISRGIAEKHQGSLYLDKDCFHTRFVLVVPKFQKDQMAQKVA